LVSAVSWGDLGKIIGLPGDFNPQAIDYA
jgi:hypothetical protein